MSGPEVHHLFHHPIADHSFSADRQTLAVARNNNVELYDRAGSKFTLKDELKGHDKTVTGVDIAPQSGMIVTCSQGGRRLSPRSLRLTKYKSRSKCLRMGAIAIRLETNPCPPPYQSSGDVCALVAIREEVCGWIWRKSDCSLLLRGRE
jgi:actin related protein 2/3 complex, subunit 1A/1B